MIQIPNKSINPPQTWNQPNTSDSLPNIWASKGLDFTENEGKIRIGKKLFLNTGTADVAEITSYPIGFRYFNNGSDSSFYTAAGTSGTGYVFKSTAIDANFAKVSTAGSPAIVDSIYSDIEVFNSKLYVTTGGANIYGLNGSNTWNNFALGGTGTANMLTAYANRMYCTKNGNTIVSFDTSETVATSGQWTLTLGSNEIITFLRSASNRVWIGTVNQFGGKGYIYDWDGSSNQATKSYRLESAGALACVIKDDIPYVMDANGKLIVWNGGTFKTIAQLNRRRNKPLYNPFSSTNQRFIHPNGMSIIKDKINILIDGTNYDVSAHNGSQEETIPSGVYEYDTEHGLTHKYSIGLTKSGSSATEFGQFRVRGVGALSEILTAQSPITTNGTFLVGATTYPDASTITTVATGGIFYNDIADTAQKAGYIDTFKVYSPNVTETWQSLYYRYRKLLGSGDKIVVKYRTEEAEPTDITVTWSTVGASTTTFTTTDANIANYAVGDEVEGIQGTGSGRCSHIVSISAPSAGVYTVVVDEVYTGATGTAKVRLQKWVKLGSNVYGDSHPYFNNLQIPQSATTTWIQFKVFIIVTGRGELEDLNLQTKKSQTANK